MGIDPVTHEQQPGTDLPSLANLNALLMQVPVLQMLQNLVQLVTPRVLLLPPELCSGINIPHLLDLLPLNSLLEELVRGPLNPSVIPESGRTSPTVSSYDMPISCSDTLQKVPEGDFEGTECLQKDSVATHAWQGLNLNLAEQEFSWRDILE